MNNILVIGAGRSSSVLIQHLLKEAEQMGWLITVADADPGLAAAKVGNHSQGLSVWLDVKKPNDRKDLIKRNDLVISLLPASLHQLVAKDCIALRKHLLTASYLDDSLRGLDEVAKNMGLIFLTELGLDPGIDHMSAVEMIEQLKSDGAQLRAFRSYAGGLVSPESDDNPWHYKITWNPDNVVLAGQGTAQYLEDHKPKYIPYHHLFTRYKNVHIEGLDDFEMYPNRDSLHYRTDYGLQDIPSIVRGTLRYPGFCASWNCLIQMGLTENNFPIMGSDKMSYRDLVEAFVETGPGTLQSKVAKYLNVSVDDAKIERIKWLGLFSNRKIPLQNATPAEILRDLLIKKWGMQPKDRDMVVMQHELDYTLEGKNYRRISTLVQKGEDADATAMSTLVGLPLAIAAKLIFSGEIEKPGVRIPVHADIYQPVLTSLKQYGVSFSETTKEIP